MFVRFLNRNVPFMSSADDGKAFEEVRKIKGPYFFLNFSSCLRIRSMISSPANQINRRGYFKNGSSQLMRKE
jgi:hypothetical protein